jgi:ribosomal protein S25
MPRARSKPTAPDDWAHELQSLLVRKENRPPGEGWLSSSELSSKLKISCGQARKILRQGLEEGVLEKFEGTKNQGKRSYHYVWYRKKKRT